VTTCMECGLPSGAVCRCGTDAAFVKLRAALAECQRERLELAKAFDQYGVIPGEVFIDRADLARRVIADAEETKP